jgi:Porin subfamily
METAMKLAKSLLPGVAVAFVRVTMVPAADLPERKAAPVEYLRICTVYGPGFFYIPGSDTCMRIGGRVRFEYVASATFEKDQDPSSFNATARLIVDTRTATEWGLLRAVMRVDLSRNSGSSESGSFGSGSSARGATKFGFGGDASGFPSFAGADTAGNRLQTGVSIESAYVQWGGLTAGRVQSFFDFYSGKNTWFGVTESDVLTQALAYTYTFGSGFSATLSIEDPKERQRNPVAGIAPVASGGINPTAATPTFTAIYPFAGSPFFPTSVVVGGVPTPGITAAGINYTQREAVPDVVGVLRVDQGWGSAQLSGAYHRIATSGSTVVSLTPTLTGGFVQNPVVPTVSGGYGAVDGNGWAVQGGLKINLPMIAAGDTLYLQAAYSKGVLSYANSGYTPTWTGTANSIGATTFATYDGVVGPTGQLTLTPAYSGVISLLHYWTPTIRQGLFAGAEHVSYSGAIRIAAGYAQGAACPTCLGTVLVSNGAFYNSFNPFYTGGTQYNMGSNLIWSPVVDLDIGIELFYLRNQMAHRQYDANSGVGRLIREDDSWRYRLRVQREF